MKIQTIERTIVKETPLKDEEPPLPKPKRLLIKAVQKLIDGWVKMMDQGVAV